MNVRTVRTVGALVRAMPPAGAGPAQRLVWLCLKAEVFDRLAARHRALAAEAASYARAAREQASDLRARQA